MDYNTLRSIASKCLQSKLLDDDCSLLWHAGEPLTAGIDFYRQAVELINNYRPARKNFQITIQTNSTLIDDEWCKFFIDNDFKIGISLDGPKFIHDFNRKNWSGNGSFEQVMKGVKLLKEYGIDLYVICVITRYSLDYPDEIFDFLCENGVRWVGFNVDEIDNLNRFSSLKDGDRVSCEIADEFSSFISAMYDNWRKNKEKIIIREFSDMLDIIHAKLSFPDYRRRPDETKELATVTIQKNGDITAFSPEFAAGLSVEYDNFVIGNINTINQLEEIKRHPTYIKMWNDIRSGVENCAESCKYFDFCGGGYVSNKFYENKSLRSTQTTACTFHRQKISSVVIQKLIDESNSTKN